VWAVLSDIHGNLEALAAVQADLAQFQVSHVFCLGDLVGYGPDPIECIEQAMAWDVTLLGNIDCVVRLDLDSCAFPPTLENSLRSTQKALKSRAHCKLWSFLGSLSRVHTQGDFLMVHGSPRNPLNEYVFPEDIYNDRKLARLLPLISRFCLSGHTHVPGVFVAPETERGRWDYISTDECDGFYRLDGRKSIVNVGSVGQPRDGNWRACYALIDGWDVSFRRVEYDVEATVAKIYAIPELGTLCGDRLREGR
jgi:diadenosine tetraphosphatase ApaH/serine/threonine PP2A family protein phosphatase